MPALYVDMRGAVMVKYHARAVVKDNYCDPLPLHTAASNGDVALAMYHVKRGASAGDLRRRTVLAVFLARQQRCPFAVLPNSHAEPVCCTSSHQKRTTVDSGNRSTSHS